MRLFIGIRLAEPVAAELSALCARLRSPEDRLRWQAPESWHITLQFLGNSTPEQLGCLMARLAEVQSPPIALRLGGPGVFDRPGIFYIEVELTPGLAELQKRITAATAQCGFEIEERAYRPHITLARRKGESRGKQLQQMEARARGLKVFAAFAAREFLLYESRPGDRESRYEVRGRFPLSARS